MQISRRSLGVAAVALLMVVGLAPGAFAASEDSFLAKLNAERTARGLGTLASHWDLVDDAEAHSHRMMEANDLHHNPNLGSVTTGWLALGENVGVGPSVNSIHNSFMSSSGHRANILGDFTHVGIGAVRESENKLWVTVVFMKASGSSTTTTTAAPTTTTGAPTTTGVTTTTASVPTTTYVPVVTTTSLGPRPVPTVAPSSEPQVALDEPMKPVMRLHQPKPA